MRYAHRLIVVALVLLVTACAKPPYQEVDATEYLVARAYAFRAPVYAAEAYQSAAVALDEGRRLIASRDYPAALDALALARHQALHAYDLTVAAKAREAAEEQARRLAEEEARKAAEEQARRLAEEEARKAAEAQARRLAEEEARKAVEPRTFTNYRVGSGDTLASIAALPGVYGDPLLWPLLYQGNRDQIKDPAKIDVGQILTIPRGLTAAELETARQKAREAGLFGLPASTAPPATPR